MATARKSSGELMLCVHSTKGSGKTDEHMSLLSLGSSEACLAYNRHYHSHNKTPMMQHEIIA